jgi:hypothetical protein
MTDEPTFRFEVSTADIEAALKRKDYGWLCEHVFNPALAQFLRKRHTDALLNGSKLPRTRRPTGTRRHRIHRRRLDEFRPRDG